MYIFIPVCVCVCIFVYADKCLQDFMAGVLSKKRNFILCTSVVYIIARNMHLFYNWIITIKCSIDIENKIGRFPGGSEVKASACNAGDLGSVPGLGRSPGEGNGNPLQYSCLENPMDRGAWWATLHGVTKSRTRLHFHFHPLGQPDLPPPLPPALGSFGEIPPGWQASILFTQGPGHLLHTPDWVSVDGKGALALVSCQMLSFLKIIQANT